MNGLELLSVPGPTITSTTEPFWAAAEAGRLDLQRCDACERWIFYPRETCPHCWESRLSWHTATGRGHLKTFSDVMRPGHPGWADAAPYIVALIKLEEGPTMLSLLINATAADVRIGAALILSPTQIGDRTFPTFEIDTHRNSEESTT